MRRRDKICYVGPPLKFRPAPKHFKGEMVTAWNAIANSGGSVKVARFDDDWAPIGHKMRKDFIANGCFQANIFGAEEIFLPEE